MRRRIEDIIASQERVEWTGEPYELSRYGLKEGVISKVKYDYWDNGQKAKIHNPFEVEYESLREHPLWVPKEERLDWEPRRYGHTRICAG